jgi:hypothetical protein
MPLPLFIEIYCYRRWREAIGIFAFVFIATGLEFAIRARVTGGYCVCGGRNESGGK